MNREPEIGTVGLGVTQHVPGDRMQRPDRGGDAAEFHRLQEARELLDAQGGAS